MSKSSDYLGEMRLPTQEDTTASIGETGGTHHGLFSPAIPLMMSSVHHQPTAASSLNSIRYNRPMGNSWLLFYITAQRFIIR